MFNENYLSEVQKPAIEKIKNIIENIQGSDSKFVKYFEFILNKKEKFNSKNTCPITIKINF